ncbi:protein kinase domain-containing protein [Spirillospora sp. CA-128828]|uniref:serine/threonine-protein kinase n=1 Tax=Spirillospora sp. CA-128828 TaxID=3240033 RepID=UPI003D8E014C
MESGLRLTERYRLVERLDDGGTMEVWRAWDELLGRPVAVKLLTPARGDLHRTFQEGVNRAAGLSHAVLETVYDSDQTRDAAGRLTSFVVTEFLDGETLADRLRGGPLTASEASDVCGQIAGAVDAAHTAGVVHGDLRPGKVMLCCGEVKVVDTGIGGIVRSARTSAGRDTSLVRAAEVETADVRALGTILSACLAPGTSEALSALAARCLSPDPPSATEIADLLARDDEPPSAVFAAPGSTTGPAAPNDHRTRALRPRPRPRHRRRGVRLATVALVLTIPGTAAAAILASAPRSPGTVPPSTPANAVPAPRTTPPRTEPAVPDPAVPDTGVSDALGRLRPIVSRGYASGEIRSDVAVDLNNVITNLENDLTSNPNVDVGGRVAQLHDKIVTRQRERGLTPGVADDLNRVLATIQT